MGKDLGDRGGECEWVMCSKTANIVPFNELDISLFLPRHHMTHQDRTTGGNRLVHDGSTGLADVEMMIAKKFWNFIRPADEMCFHSVDHT